MRKPMYPIVNGYKTCTKCLISKPISSFSPTKKTKEGLTSSCRECENAIDRMRYSLNDEIIEKNREKGRIKQNKKRKDPDFVSKDRLRCKERYHMKKNNPEYIEKEKMRRLEYYNNVKDTEEFKNKKRNKDRDPKQKIKNLIRRVFLRKGFKKKGKTYDILGADWDTVKKYFEELFQEGMNWDNHGKWHVDHILPMSTAKTVEDAIRLNHYTNLQPLWAKDNFAKQDIITYHGILKKKFPYQNVFKL